MENLNSLLVRQLNKSKLNTNEIVELYPNIKALLYSISDTYFDFEEDKALLERSIEISSKEYIENLEKTKLLQIQLVHNEKMAGIGQLSAGIAHEINNPLGYVQSNMETLKKYLKRMQELFEQNKIISDIFETLSESECKETGKKLKDFIKSSKLEYIFSDLDEMVLETANGLQRIEKIVKSLLGFARKGMESELSEYDLNKGIRDTLTIANNEIKYYAKVEEKYEQIPIINAMFGEINQVLLNLIVNSAHAIKYKGINGTISIHTFSDNEYVYCEISDDGTGITESNLKRIFEPFFTTKPVGTGTGLGLSIAHDIIVNKHKGKIDVKSALGEGTTFIIALPISSEVQIL